jgi:thioredoxin-related protein
MVIGPNAVAQQATEQSSSPLGQYQGSKDTIHPDWFKDSFLEFEEDIAEATEQGKRLIIYFHQNGCPYCNKLVEENFTDPLILDKLQSHFDLVAINMWGDREVIQVGGKSFTEKTLAEALDVNFTPTLLFFKEDRKVALRLNGYYPIVEFGYALDYVSGKMEGQTSFTNYVAGLKQRGKTGSLNHQEWIIPGPYNLAALGGGKPLAVLFEEPDCDNCTILHTRTFAREDAAQLLDGFNIVQFNRWSDSQLVTPSGKETTAEKWAQQLGLGFSPAIVFFDSQGKKIMAIDAMFKSFHILGVFDYVASGAYQSQPNFQRYLSERAERLLSTGEDVNIWEY